MARSRIILFLLNLVFNRLIASLLDTLISRQSPFEEFYY